jgi:hypothetical protein
MGRLTSSLITGALLVAIGPGCSPVQPELTVGTTLSAEWFSTYSEQTVAGDGILWLFRTADCLSCEELDFAVRRVNAAMPQMPVLALHVGTQKERRLVERFLVERRVLVESLVTLSPREFQRTYGSPVLPALLIHEGGKVVWMSTHQMDQQRPTRLDSIVNLLVAAKPSAQGSAATE